MLFDILVFLLGFIAGWYFYAPIYKFLTKINKIGNMKR